MTDENLVQLALPAPVLEDLLRRHQLHAEQVRSVDAQSHRELQQAVKRALHTRRS